MTNLLCGVFCLISNTFLVVAAFAESDGLYATDHFKDTHSQRSALYRVHVILNGYMERPNEQPNECTSLRRDADCSRNEI